jgi:hypothetical protein
MMYAITKKVVAPARTSVLTVVPRFLSWKYEAIVAMVSSP